MSQIQPKITHYSKNKENLNSHEKNLINKCQYWDDTDVGIIQQNIKASIIKNVLRSN